MCAFVNKSCKFSKILKEVVAQNVYRFMKSGIKEGMCAKIPFLIQFILFLHAL